MQCLPCEISRGAQNKAENKARYRAERTPNYQRGNARQWPNHRRIWDIDVMEILLLQLGNQQNQCPTDAPACNAGPES